MKVGFVQGRVEKVCLFETVWCGREANVWTYSSTDLLFSLFCFVPVCVCGSVKLCDGEMVCVCVIA